MNARAQQVWKTGVPAYATFTTRLHGKDAPKTRDTLRDPISSPDDDNK